jgi:type IV pilus assembly protein PilX
MKSFRPSSGVSNSTLVGQRGVVLFIALIVMVAMSLAAVALIRSVDTTAQIIGNLAFRQASVLPANSAVELATAAIFTDANFGKGAKIPDVTANYGPENYYATHDQAWDDQYGVPTPLQTQTNAKALSHTMFGKGFNDPAGNTVTYIIERMCNPNAPNIPADNSAAGTWCDMMPPKQSTGTTVNEKMTGILIPQPFYRVTVRVDGPSTTNTVSFVQAFLK